MIFIYLMCNYTCIYNIRITLKCRCIKYSSSTTTTQLFHPVALYTPFLANDGNPTINSPLFVGQGGVMKARECNSTRAHTYICDVL